MSTPNGKTSPVPLERGEVYVYGDARALHQNIFTAHHHISSDEPTSVGGADLGMNPYELLLGALGACTSMTIRMVAERKGWPLRSVAVTLKHARIHSKDCNDCESSDGQVSIIERTVKLEGDLDEAQRAKLAEIADKCPVHRTLTNEIKVRTTVLLSA